MLFILQIVGMLVQSGIFKVLFKKFKSLSKTKPSDLEKFNKFYTDNKIGTYRYGAYGSFRKFWNALTPQQKSIVRKKMFEVIKSGKKTTIIKEYKKFANEVMRTMKKVEMGKNITREERDAYKLFEDFHLGDKSGVPKGYTTIKSSWILEIKYTQSTKRMWVKMIRGKAIYKFPQVPSIAVIALLVANESGASVGKKWWSDWYWKYSTNSSNWVRLR